MPSPEPVFLDKADANEDDVDEDDNDESTTRSNCQESRPTKAVLGQTLWN
jgi:hypothetical protein